jgi:hypothetical protein
MGPRTKPNVQRRLLDVSQVSVAAEARYIAGRAAQHEARVVSLGSLVSFSTTTGDAWLLDPEDGLALCLAVAGDARPYRIVETETRFVIEWTERYRIEGVSMIFVDSSGSSRCVAGYPVEEIARAARRAIRSSGSGSPRA